jgi:ech hydrogenase subunit D
MSQEQIELITIDALLEKVRTKKDQGCRLVQISATQLPGQIELTYSFDLDSQLANLRLLLPGEEPHLPSISSIYLCSILYENEIHDLFGVQVAGMAVDFKGKFYKTAIKYPFATAKLPCASSAATPAAPATGAVPCATTPPAITGATK